MARVVVYSTIYCNYCRAAKRMLSQKGIDFEPVDVTRDRETRQWLVEATGRRTVPQIFIDDRPIGGYTDLAALDRSGELDRLLAES